MCSLTLPYLFFQSKYLLGEMAIQSAKRLAGWPVKSDQWAMKSMIWSRVSWGTHKPVSLPHVFFFHGRRLRSPQR